MNLEDVCVMLHIKGQAPKDKRCASSLIFEVHSRDREHKNAVKEGKRGMKLRFDEYCTSDLQNEITEKGLTIPSTENLTEQRTFKPCVCRFTNIQTVKLYANLC